MEIEATRQVDTRYRRIATAAAFASLFAYAVVMTVVPASLTEIGRTYGVSATKLGWLFRLSMLGFLVAVIIGGRYADGRGKMPPMAFGCVLMAAGMLLFARAGSFNAALAAMVLAGIGGGLAEGLSVAAISDLYGGPNRTAMVNLSQVVFAVGAVTAPAATAHLLSKGVDWRDAFFGAAAVSAAAALVTLVVVSTRKEKPVMRACQDSGWRRVVKDPFVLWLSLGVMLYVSAEIGVASWIAKYLADDLSASVPLAAASVAVFWLGIGLGRSSAAWAAKHMSDVSLIGASLTLGALCSAGLLLAPNPTTAIVMVLLYGICMGPVWPTIMSCAGGAHPAQSGTVIGIVAASGALGAAIVPPLIGRVADAASLRVGLWMCVAILVVNAVLFARLRSKSH
ncbi:MAG: MFS transporter [Armatimonadota bacterium]